MNEYIIVEFEDTREVIIDDALSGYKTGDVIEIGGCTHTICLEGKKNYLPLEQDINPSGTSPILPFKVYFSKD